MALVSRLGDIGMGVCPAHDPPQSYTTVFVTGASSVFTNGLVTANLTTVGMASCGHPTIVISVSSTVFAEGSGVHRVGDIGTNPGSYVTMTGSENVNAN